MFKEEIIFATAAVSVLELTNDDISSDNELCIPFSTQLFPQHNEGIMQECSKVQLCKMHSMVLQVIHQSVQLCRMALST